MIRNIEPDSWSFDPEEPEEGRGFVSLFGQNKLVVTQTPEIHKKIAKLLTDLRKAGGDQVAIE